MVVCAMMAGRISTAAAQFKDQLVQAPRLAAPERGSVQGALSGVGFTAAELARGGFRLPLPLSVPEDRGPCQAGIVPAYSPDAGLSEWGMGWSVDLSIKRSRLVGEVDFTTDDFTSPWGRLRPGDDATFYPSGLATVVRVSRVGADWLATGSDGTQYRFAAASGITTARGSSTWQLTDVVNLVGDRTTLEWTKNPSGRPFLSKVTWGGRNHGPQYELTLSYESIPSTFIDHTTGATLDRRVSQVTVSTRDAVTGTPRERWHYTLGHRTAPFGPAFYLESLQRVFAGGATQPPITYRYELDETRLASAALDHYAGLDASLQVLGDDVLQPDRSSIHDVDADGRPDLENAAALTLVQHTDAGWVQTTLPSAGGTDERCRPQPSDSNPPRILARMTADIGAPHVLYTIRLFTAPLTSQVLVCDREGRALANLVFPDDWELGPNVRLIDIDRDRRPDLVRIAREGVDILHNESDAQGIRFTVLPRFSWTLGFDPDTSWLNDFNGDGNIDITVRSPDGLFVLYGLSNRQWTTTPTLFDFITIDNEVLGDLTPYQVTFVDANKDGLTDVLLSQGIDVFLYTNQGTYFGEVPISGFRDVQSTFGVPVVADVRGTGDIEIAFAASGTTYVVQLATPATGLLASADDGMGTVARFAYARSAPRAGVEQRITLLDRLTVESSGYDPVSFSYRYGAPVLHTVGKQLMGFASVDKLSPVLTERVAFFNDDDVSGLLSLSEDVDDRTPGIVRFTRRSYDEALLHDVRWLRPSLVETGFRNTAGDVTLSSTTHYTTYEREFCPTVVVTNSPSGQLMTTSALATVAALDDDLHCLASSQSLFGTHADPALDFHYLVNLARNDLGQVTQVTQFDAAMRLLVLQDVSYDADHRIDSIGAPGRGTTSADYDALGRLATVTDPVGVMTQVSSVDPVTDAPLGIQTLRPSANVTASFHFDGRERLQASWDDFSGASSLRPLMSYSYQDATNTTPGRIDTQTLADAITGTSRNTVALLAADGEPMVSGAWLGDRFSLGAASITFRNTLTKRSSFIGTMTGSALSAITSSDLRALGTPLVETLQAGFGHAVQTTTTQQANVVGTVTTELVLGATELLTRVYQPDGFTAESAVDASGKVVRKTDENGVVHRYGFDALGRLVRIDTPDGAHTRTFDGFGRLAHVARDGIGAVTYGYDPISGLQNRKQRLDNTGAVSETSETAYDAIGRPALVALTSGTDTQHVSLDYDGQLDTPQLGQLGRLNRVRGDGWERIELFDALGRSYSQHVTLAGWRDLTRDRTYRADGALASDTLTITDAEGAVQFTSTKEIVLDNLGRASALKLDGDVLYTLSYDEEGRLARADFTSGEAITFDYDEVTHERRGHVVDAPASSGGTHWDRDPRGLVKAETYDHGTTTTRRDYDYDGRGSMTRSTTGGEILNYDYTASGLPSTITSATGSRSVRRLSRALTVSDTAYTWDANGRVVGKGEWTFEYGANGQLTRASRPGRQIEFVYDDANQRLFKRIDGHPVRANVAGGVLTEGHFIELVTIGGVLVGVLDNSQFTALLTDLRGTPFVGPDGTPNLASPYGVRDSHLGLAEVVDYARLGWDPDLDVVRMGVRDYDARLSQFLTPDPFYLEDLDACAQSPIECNLYSYAMNSPASYTDPSGKWIWLVVMVGIALYEYEGTANAPAPDTPPERIIPSPTTADLAKASVKMVVAGAAGGRAAGMFNNVIARSATAGATGTVTWRALDDIDRGSFSGVKSYGRDALLGGLTGAALGGLSRGPIKNSSSRVPTDTTEAERVLNLGAVPNSMKVTAGSEGLSRVGRWMSPKELAAMQSTGRVQAGAGGVHRVAFPVDPNAYRAAPPGDVFVTYEVPTSSLQPAGTEAWRQIVGPDSVQGRLAARQGRPAPELPAFQNLKVEQTK
jgi:RHS repeat-associated protein